MTDLAQLGLSIDAKPILAGLETVDTALAKTATAAEALAIKIKTATGQMAQAFSKVKDGGTEKQAASIEKLNFAIEHQAKAYRALLAVMREDSAIAKSSAAQRILLNSAFASATAEIDKATVAGAKNLAGLRSETAVTTSLAVAQGGLTESEKRLLDAKTRKNLVVKAHVDSVRAEIAASVKQVPMADAHVAALQREQAAIAAVTAALAKQRVEQERQGRGIVAVQRRQNASQGLSAAPKDLFASFATDPKVVAVSNARTEALKREEAATRSLTAAEAARAKQAMSMRLEPILSTGSRNLPTRATSAFNAAPDSGVALSGIASVDKMRTSLAALKVEDSLLRAGYAAGKVTHREYARGMDEITKSTNLAVAGNTRARGVFRQTASAIASATFEITGAVFGLTAAFGILSAPAVFGFKLLSTLEDTRLGMGAILISMGEINGEAIKLPKALELAEGMTKRLQQNAMKFGVDMIALADTTKAVLASGLGGGLALKEVEEIALLGSIAVKTIGLDAKQSVQEIRDLVAGGIQAGSSTLAVALGIGNADVKRWREAGTLFVELKTAMSGFQDTAILKQDTLNGAWTIFIQKIQLLFANSAQFDAVKSKLIEISNAMGSINKETGNFEFSPALVASVTSYWEAFKAGFATLGAVIDLVRTLSPLFQALGVAVNAVGFAARITFGTIAAGFDRQKEVFKGNFAEADRVWAKWKAEALTIRNEANKTRDAILGMGQATARAAAPRAIASLGLTEGLTGNTKLKGIYDPDRVTGKPKPPEDPGKGGGGARAVDPQIAFMAGLRKEVETLGMSEEAIKRYDLSKMKLTASNLRLAETYTTTIFAFKAQQEAVKALNEETQKAFDANDAQIKAAEDLSGETAKAIKQLEFETSLLGLNTEERLRAVVAEELSTNAYTKGNAALEERIVALRKMQDQQARIESLKAGTQTAKTEDFMANIAAADEFRFSGGDQKQADEMIQNITSSTDAAKEKLGELDVFAKKMAENIQQSMADFLFDPFDKGLKGMLQGFGQMLQKMIAEAVAADLAKRLFGELSGGSGSGLVGKLFGLAGSYFGAGGGGAAAGGGAIDASSFLAGNEFAAAVANGGVFSGGGLTAFASGGIMGPMGGMLNRPTVFPMANGGLGIGGEAGVEAVMPLKRGADGKLGVAAGGGGGGGNTTINVTVQGGQSAPDVRRAAGQGAREALGMLNGARRYG